MKKRRKGDLHLVWSSMEVLDKLEEKYDKKIKEKDIQILRDLEVEQADLKTMEAKISELLNDGRFTIIKRNYQLVSSLVLLHIHIEVYHDGSFWESYFERTNTSYHLNKMKVIGETFIETLGKYDLLRISEDSKKKYLSPILLHGYLSNAYTDDFFDFIYNIYSKVLKFDSSEGMIHQQWSKVFDDFNDGKQIEKEIEEYKEEKARLSSELAEKGIPKELTSLTFSELDEEENYLTKLIQEEEVIKNRNNKHERIIKTLAEANGKLEKIKGKHQTPKAIRFELEETLEKLKSRTLREENNNNNYAKELHALRNRKTLQQEKVNHTKSLITKLGSGVYANGSDELKEAIELNERLREVQDLIEKKETQNQISKGVGNQSLAQILTSSLNHLYKEDEALFKGFIIRTIKEMDKIINMEESDGDYPLLKPLKDWYDKPKVVEKESPLKREKPLLDSYNPEERKSNKKAGRKYFRKLDNLNPPALMYRNETKSLEVVVPEQRISLPSSNELDVNIYLSNEADNKEKDEFRIVKESNEDELIIQETGLPIKEGKEFSIHYDLGMFKEIHHMNLEDVMIFNNNGEEINVNKKLSNGFYYFVLKDEIVLETGTFITSYPMENQAYKCYELYLENDYIKLLNRNNYELIEIIASNHNDIKRVGGKEVTGVKIENHPIVLKDIPDLLILKRLTDEESLFFKLKLNGSILYYKSLEETLKNYGMELNMASSLISISEMLGKVYIRDMEQMEVIIENADQVPIYEDKFNFLKSFKFDFTNEGCSISVPKKSTIRHAKMTQEARTYKIPFSENEYEEVKVYIARRGWETLMIEVPQVECSVVSEKGNEEKIMLPMSTLNSELYQLKDYKLCFNTNSKIPGTVVIQDDLNYLKTKIHLRKGRASVDLKPFLNNSIEVEDADEESSLINRLHYHWISGDRLGKDRKIIEVYDRWKVKNLEVFQKEQEKENLFDIHYDENFPYEGDKKLEIYNADTNEVLLAKNIKENPTIVYLNKEETMAENLIFKILYEDNDPEDVFGEEEETIAVAEIKVKRDLYLDKKRAMISGGIVIRNYEYQDKRYSLRDDWIIEEITLAPKNFEGEELYKGILKQGSGNEKPQAVMKVFFYIEIKEERLPFLLDPENDGAQYDTLTDELCWDTRRGEHIHGPLENILIKAKGRTS